MYKWIWGNFIEKRSGPSGRRGRGLWPPPGFRNL